MPTGVDAMGRERRNRWNCSEIGYTWPMKLTWLFTGLLFATTASADMQMDPAETKYMQDMDSKMKTMDAGMAMPMTGSVDRDFATMMIPHHQGAVDMAQGELSYGKDPTMRKLARQIIAAQKTEIALMQNWLKEDAAKTAKK
jgi:uncharacterized protein (DUF305 family)